jgi:type VI protein secretion system component VasK
VRRLGRTLVPVAWLLLLPVPFLVFWWTHLLKISRAHGAMVAHGVLHDTTAPWVWAALAVVYLVWIVALTVCTIWVFDHLGYHYEPYDRQPRPTRREMRRLRRRQRAGTNLLRAREEAHRAALREISRESRRVASESDETDDAGGAADGGDDKGEQTSAADGGGDERR